MTATHNSLVTEIVSGILLGSSGGDSRNQWSFDGLATQPSGDGGLELSADQLSASNVRMAWGAHTLEVRRMSLRCLRAHLHRMGASLTIGPLSAAGAELSGVSLSGPLAVPPALTQLWSHARRAAAAASVAGPQPKAATAAGTAPDGWHLEPLAAADGHLRAQIADAHFVFDADVTIPVHAGQIDFNHARVQHVGPDSRMGVSRMGIYVDAPNGRHYLYQFDGAPLSGVELEQRGSLLAGGVSDRGRLTLQQYAEAVLRQAASGTSHGLTEQARLMLERTAVKGHVHLGDGAVAAPGLQVRLHGRAEGRNRARLNSEAVGRGITLEVPALAAKEATGAWQGSRIACDTLDAHVALRLAAEDGQLRFAVDFASLTASTVRLTVAPAH